jgi:hypothetical protein
MVVNFHAISLLSKPERDLLKKLTNGVKLMDFKVRNCNCRDPRGTGKCQYGGVCRVPIVIYKITCKMTNKIYIGETLSKISRKEWRATSRRSKSS